MTKEEFFLKTDGEIARAISEKRKYFYLISQILFCTVDEFKIHYSKYAIEMHVCSRCNPEIWDIIFNL